MPAPVRNVTATKAFCMANLINHRSPTGNTTASLQTAVQLYCTDATLRMLALHVTPRCVVGHVVVYIALTVYGTEFG